MTKQKLTSFGGYIRVLRKKAELPIRKVAAQLDIDPSLLGKIERNTRPPNRGIIKRLAEIFDQNEDFLLSEYLSDQIAYKILEEHGNPKVLKVAEKKIQYLKAKENA